MVARYPHVRFNFWSPAVDTSGQLRPKPWTWLRQVYLLATSRCIDFEAVGFVWILFTPVDFVMEGCWIEVLNGRAVVGLARHFAECVKVEVVRIVR